MSDCVFNFNFLALLLSEILGGPKFTLGGPTPPKNSTSLRRRQDVMYWSWRRLTQTSWRRRTVNSRRRPDDVGQGRLLLTSLGRLYD